MWLTIIISGALRRFLVYILINRKFPQMRRLNYLAALCLIFIFVGAACSAPFAQPISNNVGSESTRVVVRMLNLDLALTVLPTQTLAPPMTTQEPVILPSSTPLQAAVSQDSTPAPTASCINRAEFVKHLTINDNTALEAGQSFMKAWRIKNTGTCTWNTDYLLIFYSGDEMGAPHSLPLLRLVQPGDTIDLQIPMTAPLNPTTVTGNWVMQDASGNIFGFGETADRPIEVTIFVRPTPKPTPG
jgi:hypothetical protein